MTAVFVLLQNWPFYVGHKLVVNLKYRITRRNWIILHTSSSEMLPVGVFKKSRLQQTFRERSYDAQRHQINFNCIIKSFQMMDGDELRCHSLFTAQASFAIKLSIPRKHPLILCTIAFYHFILQYYVKLLAFSKTFCLRNKTASSWSNL